MKLLVSKLTNLTLLISATGLVACNQQVAFDIVPPETLQSSISEPIAQAVPTENFAPVIVDVPEVIEVPEIEEPIEEPGFPVTTMPVRPPEIVEEEPASVSPIVEQPVEQPAPIIEIPAPVIPSLKISSGVCSEEGTALLSCQSCQSTVTQTAQPNLSPKALALVNIMEKACQIPNKSAPKGYVPPTRLELLDRMSAGTNELYPDSATTNRQAVTLQKLLEGQPAIYKKMFSGLWHQPPFSDDFETYFGAEVAEAVYNFCYRKPSLDGELHSKKYLDCMYSEDNGRCQESAVYTQAQGYRAQLKNVLALSSQYKWSETRTETRQTCTYEKIEGAFGTQAIQTIQMWLSQGYTVGADLASLNRCEQITSMSQLADYQGEFAAAASVCQ